MADITSNLVAYYPCDDNGGSYYVDSISGNSLFIVSSGWTSPAKVGTYCANFATSQYASTATWAGIQGSGAFSTSMWFKTSTGGNLSLISWGHASNLGEAYRVRLESGVLWIRCTGATASVTAGALLNDGQWHHIVITQPASATMNQVKFYVDGVSQSLTFTGPTQALSRGTTVNLYLSFDFSGSEYFVGQKDDVRLYQRELAAADVLALFALGASTITDPLGWWKLDEPSGTAANDSSGNAHNGTYTNSPTLNQTGAFGNSKAVTFASASTQYVASAGFATASTNTVTIAAWIKRSGAQTASGGVVFSRGTSPNVNGLMFYDSTKIGYTWNDDILTHSYSGGPALTDGVWTHIVLVINGADARIYANGAWAATNVFSHTAITNPFTALELARDSFSTRRFNGTLDDVRVYGRALDAREVYALYQYAGSTSKLRSLTGGMVDYNGGFNG